MLFPEPAAREDKPAFETLPAPLLLQISDIVKSPVIGGQTHHGGFSAAANFVLELQDGRRIFAKGNHPGEMAHGVQTLRQEIALYKTASILRDISPPFLGAVSDGDDDGWSLGLWDYLPHTRPAPDGVMDTLHLWQSSGVALEGAREKNYIRDFFTPEKKWRRLSEPAVRENFRALFEDKTAADHWLEKNLPALLAAQDKITGPLGAEGPLHGDLRADNTLQNENRTYIIDWPNACRGPLVFDRLFFGADIEATSRGRIEDVIQMDDAAITMAAVFAGHFAVHAGRAVPLKLPRLRWMQKSTLLALLRFLERAHLVESLPRMSGQSI